MRKIFILLISFYFSLFNLNAQKFISKTHCFDGMSVGIESSATLTEGNDIICGLTHLNSKPNFDDDYYIAKLDKLGNMIWFKQFKLPQRANKLSIHILSNNTFLLVLDFLPSVTPAYSIYCMDSNANVLWKKNEVLIHFLPLPAEQAFIIANGNTRILKFKYDGTKIWEKWVENNISDVIWSNAIADFDTKNFVFCYNEGDLSVGAVRINKIGVMIMDKNTGKIITKKKIIGLNKDSLTLSNIAVLNNKITIVGFTGLDDNWDNRDDNNKGLIISLDKNLNLLYAKKVTNPNSKLDFFINDLKIDNQNILLNSSSGSYKKFSFQSIISKFNLNTENIDSSLIYNQSGFLHSYHEAIPFHLDDAFNMHQYIDKYYGINFMKSFDKYQNNTCTPKSINLTLTPYNLKVIKDDSTSISDNNLIENPPSDLIFTSVPSKPYDMCPECFCPITDKNEAKICEGQTYYLFKNGKSYSYTKQGVYKDTIKTSQGCIRFSELTLTVLPRKVKSLNYYLCSTQPSILIAQKTYNKAGIFTDTLKTKTGCDSVLTINIKSLADLTVSLGIDKEVLEGEKLDLSATTNYPNIVKKFTWLPDNTTSCDTCKTISVAPDKTQWYAVKAQIEGCFATDSINIKVLNQKLVFMPTAFRPNGDQINDVFRPYSNDAVEEIEYFIVYDRWGNHIFENTNFKPNDDNAGWNGSYKNIPANEGVYTYATQVRLKNGKTQKYLGDVMLTR